MTANITYKVDPDNYIAWQRHLEWILDDQELWDVTNRSELEPKPTNPKAVTPAEQTAIDDWKRRDKKAKRGISLWISDEYLIYIDQVSTASELWTGLQRIFQSKAAIGTIHLHQEFFWTFTEDGANIEEHIWILQGIYLQLNARGHVISDDDLLLHSV